MGHPKKYFGLKPSQEFGKYLKNLRERIPDLTQAEAARRAGLNPEQLNYFEKGVRAPRESLLIKLAQMYSVSPEEILAQAYWPQLILLPIITIVNTDELSKELIEELEKGLKDEERSKLTRYIEEMLLRRKYKIAPSRLT